MRSAGITDLRHGCVLEADWQGRDCFARSRDPRQPLPPPAGVACYTVAATTGALQRSALADRLVVALVPLPAWTSTPIRRTNWGLCQEPPGHPVPQPGIWVWLTSPGRHAGAVGLGRGVIRASLCEIGATAQPPRYALKQTHCRGGGRRWADFAKRSA